MAEHLSNVAPFKLPLVPYAKEIVPPVDAEHCVNLHVPSSVNVPVEMKNAPPWDTAVQPLTVMLVAFKLTAAVVVQQMPPDRVVALQLVKVHVFIIRVPDI